MDEPGSKSLAALGFLTVVDQHPHGLLGGYLVVNPAGRPLEFHCTAPIKPNRAQEILYGPTLAPYLYGEQIGHTLFTKASNRVSIVLTDSPDVLALRELIERPVVLAMSAGQGDESPAWATIETGGARLALDRKFAQDETTVRDVLSEVAASLDLAEPFGRIREALAEANRAA